jgi:hypothetical protein
LQGKATAIVKFGKGSTTEMEAPGARGMTAAELAAYQKLLFA